MGKWTHELAGLLTARGHAVESWYADTFPPGIWDRRIRVLTHPARVARGVWRERNRFDVVVLHEPSGLWCALLRRLVRQMPAVVVACHNVESKVFERLVLAAGSDLAEVPLGSRLKVPLFRSWQSHGAIRCADRVVCLSREDARYIASRLSVPPERIRVVPNGVDAEMYRRRVPSPASGTNVLFVGGWLDVKGRRTLPRVWREVLRMRPDARLRIVGAGRKAADVLRDFAAGQCDSVHVVERSQSPEQMREWYERADVLLMPSLSEGSPLALLEAMAMGVVPVAADVGGVPDLVEHERDGLLFAYGDDVAGARGVCRLLAAKGDYPQRAAEKARRMTWARTASLLEATLSEAAGVNRQENGVA